MSFVEVDSDAPDGTDGSIAGEMDGGSGFLVRRSQRLWSLAPVQCLFGMELLKGLY